MALINCPECNREISDKANTCPNCGFPISDHLNKESNRNDDPGLKCVHCGASIESDDDFCPTCGMDQSIESTSLIENERPRVDAVEQMICPFCGKFNDKGSMYCGFCGQIIDPDEIQRQIQYENLVVQKRQLEVQQRQLAEQEKLKYQQEMEYRNAAKCPRCGSTSLSGNKKGFGVGKAVVGIAILGPLGAVAGNVGAKKIRVTCLKCGKQFWAQGGLG
jgi:RNA polymerase subunit RPABC4/transcription elongation factor Spt4